MYQICDEVRRLTNKEKQQYSEQGYVKNLPVFSHDGALELQGLFEELSSRLPSHVDINKTNM